jgi:hypothetical protein
VASAFLYFLIAARLLLTGLAACAVDVRARRRTEAQLGKVLEAIGALRGQMAFQQPLGAAPSEAAPVTPAEIPPGLLPPELRKELYEVASKLNSRPVKLLQLAVALELQRTREEGEPTSGVFTGITIPESVVDDTATMFDEDYAEQVTEEPADMAGEDAATTAEPEGEAGERVTPTLLSKKPPTKRKPVN